MKQKKNKLKFNCWRNNQNPDYKVYTLIPSIEFVVDKQAEEVLDIGGEEFGGVKEYSVFFTWIIFTISINLEKTVKNGKTIL